MASQLERFLKGEPLNAELEELAARAKVASKGEPEDDSPESEILTRGDRERLKRMFNDPAWHLLMRLLDQRLESTRQRAVSLSEQDPVGNLKGMQAAWTYIQAFKAVRLEIEVILETAVRGVEDETGMGK